jgi:hypothetical protein
MVLTNDPAITFRALTTTAASSSTASSSTASSSTAEIDLAFDEIVGRIDESARRRTFGELVGTVAGRIIFLFVMISLAVGAGSVLLAPSTIGIYQNEAHLAAVHAASQQAYALAHTGMHSDLSGLPATGPVVFWDGSAVMCSSYVVSSDGSGKPSTMHSQGQFACDWSTFQQHPTGPIDHAFQKQLQVTVGVSNGARAVAARIPAAIPYFVQSVQPAH